VFATVSHFHPSLKFDSKAPKVEGPYGASDLPAYYNVDYNCKSFIVQAPGPYSEHLIFFVTAYLA